MIKHVGLTPDEQIDVEVCVSCDHGCSSSNSTSSKLVAVALLPFSTEGRMVIHDVYLGREVGSIVHFAHGVN